MRHLHQASTGVTWEQLMINRCVCVAWNISSFQRLGAGINFPSGMYVDRFKYGLFMDRL